MFIRLKPDIAADARARIAGLLKANGFNCREIAPGAGTILNATGKPGQEHGFLDDLPGIAEIIPDKSPFRLVGREAPAPITRVAVGEVIIGGERLVVMAGPCAVESREQAFTIARHIRRFGGLIFRGGAFKPRSSPYSFQGLGEEGLRILAEVRDKTGMPVVSEITSPEHAPLMVRYLDMLQIGARNMQNFELLKCVGRLDKPILLKRGLSATIEEWLMSAEYILSEGNHRVVLCERGIRTFEPYTRNTLDLSAIPVVKRLSHLPVIVDPSHATGIREKVAPMARAAIAAGADGLMIEVHHEPEKAMSDGPQSLLPEQFGRVMRDLYVIAPVIGKQVDFSYLEKTLRPPAPAADGATKAAAAYRGEPGCDSHRACLQFFGDDVATLPFASAADVFHAVETGIAERAVMPLQNALTGSVHENYDLLLAHDLKIVGEITLRIVHNLAAAPGTRLADIRRVLSHPTVFQQCRPYLDGHAEWQLMACQDAATAARQVRDAEDAGAAAITTPAAVRLYGLQRLEDGIESTPRNYTRFVILAPAATPQGAAGKSSLVYATANRPGALFQTLRIFAEHDINLVKLESRPVDGKPWESMFYVDVEADVTGDGCRPVMAALTEYTDFIRVLGAY